MACSDCDSPYHASCGSIEDITATLQARLDNIMRQAEENRARPEGCYQMLADTLTATGDRLVTRALHRQGITLKTWEYAS